MGAFLIDIELDIRKVHDMKTDGTCVGRYEPGKVHHFFLRPFARVRRRMEIDRLDLHPSLGYHISRHRAVDTAG